MVNVYTTFQFFPSCCKLLSNIFPTEKERSPFNSFPVAVQAIIISDWLIDDLYFQFFPSCCKR
ncbi:MAG: hypothetical protein N3E41_08560 [Thermofilaceae archaeon]|nr:hypothetical protein [Thermofilaceae archaeon]